MRVVQAKSGIVPLEARRVPLVAVRSSQSGSARATRTCRESNGGRLRSRCANRSKLGNSLCRHAARAALSLRPSRSIPRLLRRRALVSKARRRRNMASALRSLRVEYVSDCVQRLVPSPLAAAAGQAEDPALQESEAVFIILMSTYAGADYIVWVCHFASAAASVFARRGPASTSRARSWIQAIESSFQLFG
jgi:hypothetical protein